MNTSPDPAPTWAFVTPSYSGDFERCQLLCQSMDAFVTGPWHHYLIVEKIDRELFQRLSGPRRSILLIEDVLPKWIHHLWQMPFLRRRSLWWSWKTGFMIGWHVQQLVKMQMAFILDQKGLILCDSDVFFVRPFDVGTIHSQKGYRFYRSAEKFGENVIHNPSYTKAAFKQLGLPANGFPARVYVDNLVTWQSATVRAMCAHIEKISGRDWRAALGRHVIFSEYTLYGLFVDYLAADSQNEPSSVRLCQTIWFKHQAKPQEIDKLVTDLPEPFVAIGAQSFLNVDQAQLRGLFDRALRDHANHSSAAS